MKAVEYYRSVGNFDQEVHAMSMLNVALRDGGDFENAEKVAFECIQHLETIKTINYQTTLVNTK